MLAVRVWAIQELAFHAAGLACEYCDRSGALHRFKLRNRSTRPVEAYTHELPRVLANQLLVLLPCMMLAECAGLCFTGAPTLPPLRFLASLPMLSIGHDIVQYMAHRWLLHWPSLWLMGFFRHSVHHATGAATGISACYMTIPDFFLEIVLPYLLPMALIGGGSSSLSFHGLVAALGAMGGIYEHSGYDFSDLIPLPVEDKAAASTGLTPDGTESSESQAAPNAKPGFLRWLPDETRLAVILFLRDLLSSRAHAEHHARSKVSFSDGFGSPGICDTLFGTRWDLVPKTHMEAEREWQAQRRRLDAVAE
ncbi:hypothetical protein SBRCBS47491_003508 [Sporothrix bragantina]|uniref:Fatty acid hydroxylase domain-containing protein n=1 Tax=Sporothrix bragantina TaxID=671064 RepID=A0ABP0BH31_9PEZI